MHRMHCLVFTDTDLYNLTKGKLTLQTKYGAVLCVNEINVVTKVVTPVYRPMCLVVMALCLCKFTV